ncbi:hypothetical protein BKA80DRAFT_281768 [Phyllosticta citrichinensis]
MPLHSSPLLRSPLLSAAPPTRVYPHIHTCVRTHPLLRARPLSEWLSHIPLSASPPRWVAGALRRPGIDSLLSHPRAHARLCMYCIHCASISGRVCLARSSNRQMHLRRQDHRNAHPSFLLLIVSLPQQKKNRRCGTPPYHALLPPHVSLSVDGVLPYCYVVSFVSCPSLYFYSI